MHIDLKSYSFIYHNYMRFEGGTPNLAGIYGFGACVHFIINRLW